MRKFLYFALLSLAISIVAACEGYSTVAGQEDCPHEKFQLALLRMTEHLSFYPKYFKNFLGWKSTTQLINFLSFSGKRLNDLGDYLACKGTNESYYVMFTMKAPWPLFRVGACLPKELTIEFLNSHKEDIIRAINFFGNITLEPSTIDFIDVKEENRLGGAVGIGYISFCAILGVSITMAVIATVLDCFGYMNIHSPKKETSAKLLNCFSLIRNVRSLLNPENKTDKNLDILNGIRVLSMFWIIFGHSYDFGMYAPLYNFEEFVATITKQHYMAIVMSGTLAVDIFFFMSGFLATLSLVSLFRNPNHQSFRKILLSYLFRYARITPLLAICLMYRVYIERGMRDYPFHPKLDENINNCGNSWFGILFYSANYMTEFSSMCMHWTWYLMVDMQMYFVCPFLVLPFLTSYRVGFIILGIFGLGSFCVQIHVLVHYGMTSYSDDYFNQYYNKPYCRILPYLMGIAFCFLYLEDKKTEGYYKPLKAIRDFIVSRPWIKNVTYTVGFPFLYEMVFLRSHIFKPHEPVSVFVFLCHEVINRIVFLFGLMMMIYPTLVGKGRVLRKIFGHPIFSPLAKLTYGAYLTHPFFYTYIYWYSLNGYYFTQKLYISNFIAAVVVGFLASFILTLIFESPINRLVRDFFDPRIRSGLIRRKSHLRLISEWLIEANK